VIKTFYYLEWGGLSRHLDTAKEKVAIIARIVYNPKMPKPLASLTMKKIAVILTCLTLLGVAITGAAGCVKGKVNYEAKPITIINESGQPLNVEEGGQVNSVQPGASDVYSFDGPNVALFFKNDAGEVIFSKTYTYAELEKLGYKVVIPPPPGNDTDSFFKRIAAEPEKYNGLTVTFTGYVFHGFESAVICESLEQRNPEAPYYRPGGVQIWFRGALPEEVEKGLSVQNNDPTGYPAYFGKVEVTGVFQYGESYGHMDAYKYQMQVTGAKLIEWKP
jgi:hypothetical protein